MIKNAFIESLKIVDGRFIHPELHWQRITDTQRVHFGNSTFLPLSSESIPPDKRLGTLKCRIIYDQEIRKIDFETYSPRRVHTLKLVDGSGIDYTFKYADRDKLIQLQQSKGTCDEILIYQNGRITDTSYSNIVLYDGVEYITPSTYLLNGLKRQYLLQQGKIKEKDISILDLPKYQRLYLINALLDIEDNISVEPQYIHLNPQER